MGLVNAVCNCDFKMNIVFHIVHCQLVGQAKLILFRILKFIYVLFSVELGNK